MNIFNTSPCSLVSLQWVTLSMHEGLSWSFIWPFFILPMYPRVLPDLMCNAGRAPNTHGLGLENVGIRDGQARGHQGTCTCCTVPHCTLDCTEIGSAAGCAQQAGTVFVPFQLYQLFCPSCCFLPWVYPLFLGR